MVESGNGLNFIKDAYPKITFTEDRTRRNVHKYSFECNTLRSWNQGGKKPIPDDDHLFDGIEDTIVPNIYGKNIWEQIPHYNK